VNSRSRLLYAVAHPFVVCLSVVGNAHAPYSGGCNFPQYFYGIRYLGHPLTSIFLSVSKSTVGAILEAKVRGSMSEQ